MATYERATRIPAPLDRVWEFHSTPDGLRALTPGALNVTVESVVGPDGDPDPEVLTVGSVLELSAAPLGIDLGDRGRWVAEITARERTEGSAYFVDEMRSGPLRSWEHTHAFYADGDETVLRDRVRFRTRLGATADRFVARLFEPGFRYRHRRTRELLAG
ncbi:MAG: cyclase [Halobacteriaceae archaeon]